MEVIHSASLDELVRSCIKGNRAAQKRIYDLFSSKMYVVCLRYATTTDEATDFLQEGFIRAFQKIDSYNFKGSFEGWLRRVLVNVAIRANQKNKKYNFTQSIDEYQELGNVSGDGDFNEDGLFSELTLTDLLNCIQQLPKGYQTIFNMYVLDEYSHAEIAEELGITVNTSKSQLMRARKHLQQIVYEKLQQIEQHNEQRKPI